eukprot:4526810-Alexandrium_andersonii.AAC.1
MVSAAVESCKKAAAGARAFKGATPHDRFAEGAHQHGCCTNELSPDARLFSSPPAARPAWARARPGTT